MSSSEDPKFTSPNGDERRPIIIKYSEGKFQTGDYVYLLSPDGKSREGPYCIASVPSPGMYTLSLENGEDIENGAEIEEKRLEAHAPR